MLILGISCFYHDSAAAIIEDGKIIAAAQEERFTRFKHDESFPQHAIQFCLDESGCSLRDIDAVVFYEKPLLKLERILESYLNVAPKGLGSFLFALPKWIQEKLFFKSLLKREFKAVGDINFKKTQLLFTEHHYSHAASAYYPSGYEQAAILTIDGVGEWATASIGIGEGREIRLLREMHFPHSIGLLYSAFTYFMGFKVNSGEYKLMGLSPFGRHGCDEVAAYKALIRKKLLVQTKDGGIQLQMERFAYLHSLRMIKDKEWETLFSMPVRKPSDPIEQQHCDLALAIQEVTEELILELAQQAKELTGASKLCYAGGVALNCVANGKLAKSGLFDSIYIPSSPGDSGGAIGAALYAWHHFYKNDLPSIEIARQNRSAYLGPGIGQKDLLAVIRRGKAALTTTPSDEALCSIIAKELAEGKVVGWMQGRMEFGPRALGNRSILASPIAEGMQSKLNLKIKFREDFRPFAPVLTEEAAQEYYELPFTSNYMEWVVPLQGKLRLALPHDFQERPWKQKLDTTRSPLQAVTHADFTARPQTVSSAENPLLHLLLQTFEKETGHPVLVNTSFNVRGEPIVCSAEDAYDCFLDTDMDILVVDRSIFYKSRLPEENREISQKRIFKED
jgi:carbamoyltransferase